MQWGQIKTLFILCFLVLDAFLLYHFLKEDNSVISTIPEYGEEENLRNNITGLDNIPEEPGEASMLHAQRKKLTTTDKQELQELPNQTTMVINDYFIVSQLDDPVPINVEGEMANLREHIWNDSEYQYSGKDETNQRLIFFQQIENPIFYNLSGAIIVQLNSDGEMTHYAQALLKKSEEQPEPEELISPMEPVTNLYKNNELSSGNEITNVQMGYQNLLPLPNGVQVLAPTWEITVNNNKSIYVNATEGHSLIREPKDFSNELNSQLTDYSNGSSTMNTEVISGDMDEEERQSLIDEMLSSFQEATSGQSSNGVGEE
ncbi:hypothetical protein J416_13279 [Gracilibacillus halophilus YIM-C55.5]|uniref:Regulatory protein YycH-like domain-containing protein n=1 Tax=Gracilibacillus halophilus YIM-C55.5 TaxID=1308866 RepID=N4WIE4_9BACI|nr:two-component system regulatory protein YycI [Gracilibacillus halophilus]ENH95952.1 hypothetical protein J416_13279 [Gracilibacillus halophilus YIM-C55.5]